MRPSTLPPTTDSHTHGAAVRLSGHVLGTGSVTLFERHGRASRFHQPSRHCRLWICNGSDTGPAATEHSKAHYCHLLSSGRDGTPMAPFYAQVLALASSKEQMTNPRLVIGLLGVIPLTLSRDARVPWS
jgi:hypothetical protein